MFLKITGVKKPTTLTVKQLKTLGEPTSRLTVLQCSGNGRAFFEHGASGSQWSTGAAGTVKMVGMVSDILDHLGGSRRIRGILLPQAVSHYRGMWTVTTSLWNVQSL